MTNEISVRVNSILVQTSPSGLRIGTVHGHHQPGEVERADICDLYEAIGRFITQARGAGPSYVEHLKREVWYLACPLAASEEQRWITARRLAAERRRDPARMAWMDRLAAHAGFNLQLDEVAKGDEGRGVQ